MTESGGTPFTPLRVDIELSLADVLAARFWTLWQLRVVRVLAVLHSILVLVAAVGLLSAVAGRRGPPTTVYIAATLTGALAVFPLREALAARRHFIAMAEDETRGSYAFHEDRFEWTLGRAPGHAERASVSRVAQTDWHLFLLTRSGRTHALPRRCLSEEQSAAIAGWGSTSRSQPTR